MAKRPPEDDNTVTLSLTEAGFDSTVMIGDLPIKGVVSVEVEASVDNLTTATIRTRVTDVQAQLPFDRVELVGEIDTVMLRSTLADCVAAYRRNDDEAVEANMDFLETLLESTKR